jgi:LysM repeat protein
MNTNLIPSTLALALALLCSCARHDSGPSPQPVAKQASTASGPAVYCPHCARQISGEPQKSTYGPATYQDNTPPGPLVDPLPAASAAVPVVPAPTPGSAATVPANPKPAPRLNVAADGSKFYYIAPGDSLWKISKAFGVSIEAIKSANGMETDVVIVGNKLDIPQE